MREHEVMNAHGLKPWQWDHMPPKKQDKLRAEFRVKDLFLRIITWTIVFGMVDAILLIAWTEVQKAQGEGGYYG